MNRLNKEAFRRYFFYGDQNPEGTLEGIMFFTYQNMKTDPKGNEQDIIEKFIQEVKPLYRQYYRFVELNNRCHIYNYKKAESDQELEAKISQKIEQLRNIDEIVPEEEIQAKIWREIKKRNAILEMTKEKEDEHVKWIVLLGPKITEPYPEYGDKEMQKEWKEKRRQEWQEETLCIVKKIREELEKRRTKRLIIEKDQLRYSYQECYKYAHIPEGGITKEQHKSMQQYVEYDKTEWEREEKGKTYHAEDAKNEYIYNCLRHWTEDVYDILKILVQIEKEDRRAYTDLWLRTRQNRAKNKTIKGITKQEIAKIDRACERMKKIRLEEEKIEDVQI